MSTCKSSLTPGGQPHTRCAWKGLWTKRVRGTYRRGMQEGLWEKDLVIGIRRLVGDSEFETKNKQTNKQKNKQNQLPPKNFQFSFFRCEN